MRDQLVVRFWLSKPAKVAIVVDGKALDGSRATAAGTRSAVTPRSLAPGTYPVRLVARSLDGNPGATTSPSFTVARDTEPPALAAAKANGRVYWHAKDGESACCKLRLELRRGPSGRRPLAKTKGAAAIPHGYWLVAVSPAMRGNRTRRSIGLVVGARVGWIELDLRDSAPVQAGWLLPEGSRSEQSIPVRALFRLFDELDAAARQLLVGGVAVVGREEHACRRSPWPSASGPARRSPSSMTGGPGIAISTIAMSGCPAGPTVSQRKSPISAMRHVARAPPCRASRCRRRAPRPGRAPTAAWWKA